MARNLPTALELRELKYGEKATAAERSQMAQQLLESGRAAEALELLLAAGDEAGVSRVKQRAVSEGRASLLVTLGRRGQQVTKADWKGAGDAAMGAERWREAYRCYTMADDEEGLAAVREKIPDYEIYVPRGK